MYRFSFVNSIAGKAQEVSRQLFHEIIAREDIKNTCELIAKATSTEQIGRLKRGLPAFCWHAWFDDGKRKNYAAHPSGLIMMDLDHVEKPREMFEKLAESAKAMGLLAAHVTPSTKGLRLVFPIPEGMDIVEAQGYYVKALGLKNVDACTKDLARMSFCVPEAYWLYVDEEGLFEGRPHDTTDLTAPNPVPSPARGKGVDSNEGDGQNAEGDTKNTEEATSYPSHYEQGVTTPFPRAGEGQGLGAAIPYSLLVECLQELLGGVPAHGSRNNFIFSMAAYLRYVCDDDPEWIAQILPTYGEARDKWRRTIDSACQRAQYKAMPQIVKRAIDNAQKRVTGDRCLGMADSGDDLPPEMPKKLPKLIQHLTKNVPEVCRPAVANAVFPALAAHLNG